MNLPIFLCLCVALLLCAFLAILVLSYYKREQKLLAHLKNMLEESIAGTFTEGALEDSAISEIESDMWRFLQSCQVSSQNLQKQKQQIHSLISDTSHQAITPISNIRIYTELLNEQQEIWKKEYGIPGAGMEEEIAVIQAQTEKLEFLIHSLAKLSCLEIGVLSLDVEYASVSDLLLSIKRQFQKKAEQKKIAFSVELSEELAMFDIKWTEEAVANIVDNAIKYTPSGGTVAIRVVPYQLFLCIEVSDSGIGMKESETAKIFNRFYRSPAVKGQPGIGIGLSLAREIVQKQKGYIKVSSVLGEGSKFCLYLFREKYQH